MPTVPSLQSSPAVGFGNFQVPNNESFSKFHTIQKVKKIVAIVFTAIALMLSLYLTVLFPPAALIPIALGVLTAKLIINLIGVCNQVPPINHLFSAEQTKAIAPLATYHQANYSGIAPKDSIEAFEWKCKLIEKAQKSIVLSGCYAGGRSFDRVLDLITKRMAENPQLKVSIISSKPFHTRENKGKIAALTASYPDRFLSVGHEEYLPHSSPSSKDTLTTNHTKGLVIDGGAYFVIGGAGIVSCFTDYSGLEKPQPTEKPYGILSGICPEAYRDMDFVFHSPDPNGLGARLHVELSKLIEVYRYRQTRQFSPQQDLPNPSLTYIPEFDESAQKLSDLSLACFCSGPEQTRAHYEEALIEEINNAKESIVFAHLFFIPTPKLEAAVIQAANRGVKIQILTNKTGSKNPPLHLVYVERSRYGYKRIFQGKENPNIEIYEFDVPKVTYHKKITVIDGETVLTGSSNIIPKSLGLEDYEIDFAIKSKEFAQRTLKTLEPDFQDRFKINHADIYRIKPGTVLANTALQMFRGLY